MIKEIENEEFLSKIAKSELIPWGSAVADNNYFISNILHKTSFVTNLYALYQSYFFLQIYFLLILFKKTTQITDFYILLGIRIKSFI